MSIELALRWTKAAVIVAVAIWELVRLARRRGDLPLRVLAPGLVCLAWAATMGINTPILDPIQDWFGESWRYIMNGSWSVMAYCFAAYFLLANPAIDVARRKRKALVELGLLIGVLIIMVVVHETAPPETWDRPRTAEQYRSPWSLAWSLSVDGYALGAWFVGVMRAGALRRRLRHPWARAAFWLVMTGGSAMALGVNGVSLIRLVIRCFTPDAARGGLLSALYSTGQLGGQFALAVGLALVPLATVVLTARAHHVGRLRSRYARQLQPLWHALVTAFPYISVSTDSEQHDEGFGHRTAEITDGLAELARDCPEPAGNVRDPRVAADVIAAGFTRHAARANTGEDPDRDPPYPRVEPDFATWRERARWMIAISDALRRRGDLEEEPARAGRR